MTISLLLIITVLAAALSLVDGITRLRGRRGNSVLAVIEIIAAVLMLLALFPIFFPAPFGVGILSIVLEIVLILQLILRGSTRRGGAAITIIALVLNSIVLVVAYNLFQIPGLNG